MRAVPVAFQPVATGEIPLPPSGKRPDGAPEKAGPPGVVLRAGAETRARRKVLLLGGIYLGISALLFGILLRIPGPAPLVVYRESPRCTLLGGSR